MSSLFSKSCEYAIRASLYISGRPASSPVLVREISMALNIPHHFLSKVLHQLARQQVLVSHKGVSGGFTLARPAECISLQDIIVAIEGEGFLTGCILGIHACGDDHPCFLHRNWLPARTMLQSMITKQSLSDILRSPEDLFPSPAPDRTPS